ncbi:hypothetical protein J1605_011234 [Eschrichtius robustus]|uniref:Uncharacterized protein n=1 Tax=Eschrichtius robustus TaxID=9764 RepID=A0AB34GRG3_ESCRO|nr:hypothetical protein J1605_011234 [Eschrichtius robustus]
MNLSSLLLAFSERNLELWNTTSTSNPPLTSPSPVPPASRHDLRRKAGGGGAGLRRPLNAAQGQHGAALDCFFLGQQHPEEESSLDSAARSGLRRPPPTSGPAPSSRPPPSPPPPPGPASRVDAGPPGVHARAPVCVCALEPVSDPRPRPAQNRL